MSLNPECTKCTLGMKLGFDKGAILDKSVCLSLDPEYTMCTKCTLGMKLDFDEGVILEKNVCVCLSNLSVPSAP